MGRLFAGINGGSLASLFAILAVLVPSTFSQPKGLPVDIAVSSGTTFCGDGDRLLVASVLPTGRVRLNDEDVELNKLDRRLKEIFRDRAERLIFVIPDATAAFGDVVALIDIAKGQADHVAMLSHAVLRNPGNCGPAACASTSQSSCAHSKFRPVVVLVAISKPPITQEPTALRSVRLNSTKARLSTEWSPLPAWGARTLRNWPVSRRG
jgi:biopolymer transport protein ExbD